MKILTAEQNRQADAYTMENEPIASVDLMERAATACADWIREELDIEDATFHIFCGIGNNGGDGMALARLLAESGNEVRVYILRFSEKTSADFAENYKRLQKSKVQVVDIHDPNFNIDFDPKDLIIDAVFGTGLNKPVKGWLKEAFQRINYIPLLTISVDLPSGLFAEFNHENDLEAVIRSDFTLTFQQPKLALVLVESGAYCGEWHVLDIGLDQEYIDSLASHYFTTDADDAWLMLKDREKFQHKNDFGHAMIVSGSKGKMGAAVLSSKACLRSGVGLLTCLIPDCGYDIIQTAVPEAMCLTSKDRDEITEVPKDLDAFNCIGIGPGMGMTRNLEFLIQDLFERKKGPFVIDADAINILAKKKAIQQSIPENSILTPHPGEFRRLVGTWKNDEDKLKKQIAYSKKYNVILVVKGAHTSISTPDGDVYFNTSGNPGMATAGSGDVLLGIITALVARGYESLEAARLGVYLHGLSGDLAAFEMGQESMIAVDIIEHLPDAFLISNS